MECGKRCAVFGVINRAWCMYVVVVMFDCLLVIFSGQNCREVDGSDPEKAREIMIFITCYRMTDFVEVLI